MLFPETSNIICIPITLPYKCRPPGNAEAIGGHGKRASLPGISEVAPNKKPQKKFEIQAASTKSLFPREIAEPECEWVGLLKQLAGCEELLVRGRWPGIARRDWGGINALLWLGHPRCVCMVPSEPAPAVFDGVCGSSREELADLGPTVPAVLLLCD
jgi:hypothetical protein